MQKDKKDKNFIKKPIYEGGPKALKAFIRDNLRYPEQALKERAEGTVVLKYSVGHQGNVVDTRVISGLGYGCDEEAIRLTRLLKFKVPKTRGVKVVFHKDIKIHFRLPKQKPTRKKAVGATLQYSYALKKKGVDREPPEEEKGSGYSYTIDF